MEEKIEICLEEEEVLDINIEDEEELEFDIENDVIEIIENNYNELSNKPRINNIELKDNRTLDELKIQKKGDYASETLTNLEIENIINNFI